MSAWPSRGSGATITPTCWCQKTPHSVRSPSAPNNPGKLLRQSCGGWAKRPERRCDRVDLKFLLHERILTGYPGELVVTGSRQRRLERNLGVEQLAGQALRNGLRRDARLVSQRVYSAVKRVQQARAFPHVQAHRVGTEQCAIPLGDLRDRLRLVFLLLSPKTFQEDVHQFPPSRKTWVFAQATWLAL